MAETKSYRRKVDGFVTSPITEAQAKSMDGYPGDFEEVKPFKVPTNKEDAPADRKDGATG